MHTPLTLTEVTMPNCPICTTPSTRMREVYHLCDACGAWFQSPPPRKVYHGPAEPGVDAMPESEQAANRAIAAWLFNDVMGGRPGRTLDIGSKIPVLSDALSGHLCNAWALDAEPARHRLPVPMLTCDFETTPATDMRIDGLCWNLITLIHVYEHVANPLAAMRKLRELVTDDGAVFIRMPDNTVPGYERDLTSHHFRIHPWFHSIASICEILARTKTFTIEKQTPLAPGQRDLVLRPLER